jgi:hypothetical protein
MTKDEALDKALDWYDSGHEDREEFQAMIENLLATPVQEPVASMSDEQDAFEKVFKLPDGITRFDGGYAPTSHSAWSAQQNCYRWEGWKARSKLCATPPAARPAPVQEPHPDDLAVNRFAAAMKTKDARMISAYRAMLAAAPEKGQP